MSTIPRNPFPPSRESASLIQYLPSPGPVKKKPSVCWQMAQYGSCPRGDDCPHRHDGFLYGQYKSGEVCRRWLKGTCPYNSYQCIHSHYQEREVVPTQSQSREREKEPQCTNTNLVLPSEGFFMRRIQLLEDTVAKLRSYLKKTDHRLKAANGVKTYPPELEKTIDYICGEIETFTGRKHGILSTECNDDGNYRVRRMNEVKKGVRGCYTLSTAYSSALCKSGSGSGPDGMCGRVIQQSGPGIDPNVYAGILSVLEESMKSLVHDVEAWNAVYNIIASAPSLRSYIPIDVGTVVNLLDECAVASAFPGDPKLLGERFLNMGSMTMRNIVSVPPQDLNADIANAIAGTKVFRTLFTWCTEKYSISAQVREGVTSQGRIITGETRQMIQDMVRLNSTFMKKFMMYDRLLSGTSGCLKVMEYVDAVPFSPIGDSLAELADRIRDALAFEFDEDEDDEEEELKDTILSLLKNEFEKWYTEGDNFFTTESKVAGDSRLLAQNASDELSNMVVESDSTGENTLILAERVIYDALKQHKRDTFDAFFRPDNYVGPIVCSNGREAARLYQLTPIVKILFHGSMFLINAHVTTKEVRLNLCGEFLAIKSTFVGADLMRSSALSKSLEELLAFAIQLENPLGETSETTVMSAIRNNSPANYNFGHMGRDGLAALKNILVDLLGIKGIHSEVIASFAMHLGAKGFEEMFAKLGHVIDCSDMPATLKELKKKQKDRGVLSAETRRRISENITASFNTHQRIKAERMRRFEESNMSTYPFDGIKWTPDRTTWRVDLPKSIFKYRVYIATFESLGDAKATMKYAHEKMKGLCAKLPNNYHFDSKEKGNKVIVDDIIQYARNRSSAHTNAGTRLRDVDIL